MRKYYRAVLAIIASISLVALLFYRHEYNRLRYVLEVLDYFGTAKSNSNCSNEILLLPASVGKLYESGQLTGNHNDESWNNEPVPSWQRLTDSIYIYSAYRLNNETAIRAIALAKGNRLNLVLSCHIFYENEIEPVVGEFTYNLIVDDSSSGALIPLPANLTDNTGGGRSIYRGYHFICDYTINSGNNIREAKSVDMVKFATNYESTRDRNTNESANIMIPVKETGTNRIYGDDTIAGICVAPPPFIKRPIIARDIINFITYHSSLDVKTFLVYDSGIPPRFNDILKRITKEPVKRRYDMYSNNFTYTTVPWNFPLSTKIPPDIVRSIVEADCLYRMYEKVGIVATLTWNEYIILKYHRTIGKLFRDFDRTGFVANVYRVSLVNLCLDETSQRNGNASTEPILFRKKNIIEDNNRCIYIHRQPTISDKGKTATSIDDTARMETPSRREVTSDVIVTNRYEQCARTDDLELIPLDDRYVGKFSKFIQNSTITNLFLLHAH